MAENESKVDAERKTKADKTVKEPTIEPGMVTVVVHVSGLGDSDPVKIRDPRTPTLWLQWERNEEFTIPKEALALLDAPFSRQHRQDAMTGRKTVTDYPFFPYTIVEEGK